MRFFECWCVDNWHAKSIMKISSVISNIWAKKAICLIMVNVTCSGRDLSDFILGPDFYQLQISQHHHWNTLPIVFVIIAVILFCWNSSAGCLVNTHTTPHTRLVYANAASDPSTSCIVYIRSVCNMHVSVLVFEVCMCECVHNHKSKHVWVCVLCECVSLTSCTGWRKWGGTQSGPHLSVFLSVGRSLGP